MKTFKRRPSHYGGKDRPSQPGDEAIGTWPHEMLLAMDQRFCAAMERAISRGLERRPEESKARAA